MLSRVAENLYWIGRYVERAENVARIIDVNNHLILDAAEINIDKQWEPLVVASGDEEDFEKRYNNVFTEANVIRFLTFDEENPNSILSSVRNARFNAKTVREAISPEMFEEINNLFHKLNVECQKNLSTEELKDLYEYIIRFSHVFMGLTERTLLQDEGWCFIRLGRMLERADKITRILDVKYFILLPSVGYVNTPIDDIQWASLLKSASAFEPYRKKHNVIEYDKVIEFLVMDKFFPRSVKYSVKRAYEMLKRIDKKRKSDSLIKIKELNAKLNVVSSEQIKNFGLHEYLDFIQQELNTIGNNIYTDFFSLSFS